MKKGIILSALIIATSFIYSCDNEKTVSNTCDNGVFATVRDLTGLDGCGYVFELADGTRLEPIRLFYCGTPPLPKEVTENPLYNFQFIDGKQVRIGFEEVPDVATVCMVGKVVKITCIEEINVTNE